MSPEVADAIGVLTEKGILSPGQSATLLRVARRDLVSVRLELRALLYAGVLLAVSGVGLFLKENQERIGPVAIASLLAAAAVGCFLFVLRRSPPFAWKASGEAHVAADYLLLLAVLLVGSDLAYIESRFRFLGADWRITCSSCRLSRLPLPTDSIPASFSRKGESGVSLGRW